MRAILAPRSRRVALAACLAAVALLPAMPAQADPPKAVVKGAKEPVEDPDLYVDPAYDASAHGGLPYAAYLRMSRGTTRRSTGMMVTGIVVTAFSATMMGVGTAVYAAGSGCQNDGFGQALGNSANCSHGTGHVSGMAVLIAASIGVAIGLPLLILGNADVPYQEGSGQNHRVAPAWARLVPVVAPHPTNRGVALTWRF